MLLHSLSILVVAVDKRLMIKRGLVHPTRHIQLSIARRTALIGSRVDVQTRCSLHDLIRFLVPSRQLVLARGLGL